MKETRNSPLILGLIFLIWILITYTIPYINHLYNFRQINLWILPAFRMTLMFLVTYVYVRYYEKLSFSLGFHFYFKDIGKNVVWALVFFLLYGIVWHAFQFLIVRPLHNQTVVMSSALTQSQMKTFIERLVEFLYIVYEGFIEVFIFIGFLLDRLVKRWGWTAGIILSNIGFAVWHYNYLRQGVLIGSLMLVLSFVTGVIISMNYLKTRNSLAPAICHTLVDAPNSIRILLGLM